LETGFLKTPARIDIRQLRSGIEHESYRVDPPGTFCSYEALRDLVKKTKAKSFIDVGCCSGNFSKLLCSIGLRGA